MFVIGKGYFRGDGLNNYIIFPLLSNYFTTTAGGKRTLVQKSKRISRESIKPPATSDNSLAPKLTFIQNVKVSS